ncbi:DUF4893 domain-containing protein [Sphingomonas sp. HDW15A]|uniref:DUF4893 domain-containing protein n=1 Tax=Sphingomonas sp. HDW15A TaxID=2714942 RepID=UPI00140ABB6F|nr:DUF4893 domain-containing protein [Sphingomonas sp. HDW15A]QIK95392.1 DUF4893 domain-containing protein [Sphingomonas sp. HDW15A]
MRTLILFAALALPACATTAEPRMASADNARDWRFVATGNDRERLRDWRKAFATALARARAAGHGAEIDREGSLLQPDAAIGQVPVPNGDYRCRVIKLGAKSNGLLDYVTYPAFTCRIHPEGGIQGFAKLTGSQRPIGLIYPNDALRQVFLGTLVLGDETRAMQYGRDEERDIAAFVEKIGPNRWRMVMPYPAFESLTDVMELVPAQ